jgi:antitoxin component of MazEF toxin-antitoxin module
MNRDPYAIALGNAMTEIQKAYPEIQHSFIFTKDYKIITGEAETDQKTISSILEAVQAVKEKTEVIGNLKNFQITGKNGKLNVSKIEDMNLVLTTSKNVDTNQIYSLARLIIPTVIKSLGTTAAPNLQSPFIKSLTVDPLSGLFDVKAVQIDEETLRLWNTSSNSMKDIDQVKIETPDGNSSVYKVQKITVGNLKGKNIIRIPAKLCNQLNINRGDTVNVSPDGITPADIKSLGASSNLQSPSTKQLIVDSLSGFFDGKAVQIDEETLRLWNQNNNSEKDIDRVRIETVDGNSNVYTVKKIAVGNLKGKNIIRIPEKVCSQLHVKRGDAVSVSPKI